MVGVLFIQINADLFQMRILEKISRLKQQASGMLGGDNMRCLRCGNCCKNLWVVIVDDPAKGLRQDNLIVHEGRGVPCKHLREENGVFSCEIHHYKWYKKTPCYQHGQIERSKDDACRIGKYLLEKKHV